MTTYYIATTGDDTTGDGSQGNPYRTLTPIMTVINDPSYRSSADIVEIMDEGDYDSRNIRFSPWNPTSLTIRHTASHLGRPFLDATGVGAGEYFFRFDRNTIITASFEGVEVGANGVSDFFDDSSWFSNVELHITGCFFYGARAFGPTFNRTAQPPSTIKQSTFFFEDDASGGDMLQASNGLEISNCLLTSSDGFGVILSSLGTFGTNNVTASFSTIISRRTNQSNPAVYKWGKLINCVVSSSGPGINAYDHTYNLVIGDKSGDDRYSFVDTSGNPVSEGTGDIKGYPTFVDGDRIGNDPAFIQFYALAEGSLGINQGIEYDGIVVDITGTTRPQGSAPDMGAFELVELPWLDGDGTETYQKKFGSGFEIHGTANKLATRTFASNKDNRQAPYFVTIPGPANLRRRTTPYKNET